MLEKWDGAENIFIAPTLLNLDPINDFSFNYYKSDVYSENVIKAHCDCVHPNHAGYSHIGDSIAGVIELIRKEI